MRVTDPRAMRALAHPLRLDLIEALTVLGPSTAAACARHLGSTQALCSFHLRQLAKYGFVEQAADSGDRRERPWRLTDVEQSWPSENAEQLDRVFLQREADKLLSWVDRSKTEPEEWRTAGFAGGATLPVTAEELTEIAARLRAVLDPYIDRLTDPAARPAGARPVRIMLAGTPQNGTPQNGTPQNGIPQEETT